MTATSVYGSPSPDKTQRMLLHFYPRSGRLRRASLLLLLPAAAAVLLSLVPVTAGHPAARNRKCPSLDCAKEGRKFCKPGSSHCGPCLPSLVENEDGRCVDQKRQPGGAFYVDLDDEIDYLQSVIAKQEVTESQPPRPPAVGAVKADVRKSETDVPQHKQKSLNANTVAPLPNTTTPLPRTTVAVGRGSPIAAPAPKNDNVIIIVISLCVVVGTVAVILATACYIKSQNDSRLSQKVDYPAFGGAGVQPATANGTSTGDKKLAESAQMYHYQHRKQQMLSVGNRKAEHNALDPEVTSDEDEVEGDFTVYECPGLAPTGEMEVKNPLFDDSTVPYQGTHK